MGTCTGCGGNHVIFNTIWICRVCELVDKDATHKRVAKCEDCGEYICEKCWNNWPRRIMAFGKDKCIKAFGKFKQFIS